MREYSSPSVNTMIEDGNITDLDNTLAAQIVEFYYLGKENLAENLTYDIAASIVPPDRGLLIRLNNTLIYDSAGHKSAATINSSSLVISSKRLTFKLVNETELYGPVWLEVTVWA
jgi:hypothetical protein